MYVFHCRSCARVQSAEAGDLDCTVSGAQLVEKDSHVSLSALRFAPSGLCIYFPFHSRYILALPLVIDLLYGPLTAFSALGTL